MLRALLCLVFIASLTSCNLPAQPENDSPLQDTVDAMAAVKSGLRTPEHLLVENAQRDGSEFDPNLYFTALKHLSMAPGYVLDYVYHYDGMGGRPVLYARPEGLALYRTYEEYAASSLVDDSYLNAVIADGTPESYFELVMLSIMGNQFYLDWHANYNDTSIVCDSEALEALLSDIGSWGEQMPLTDKMRARLLNLEPVIEIGADTVTVQIVTFTKWGGFFRETYTLQRGFPHEILDFQTEPLVAYDCGIMF
jgi:hypothetical protein